MRLVYTINFDESVPGIGVGTGTGLNQGIPNGGECKGAVVSPLPIFHRRKRKKRRKSA